MKDDINVVKIKFKGGFGKTTAARIVYDALEKAGHVVVYGPCTKAVARAGAFKQGKQHVYIVCDE